VAWALGPRCGSRTWLLTGPELAGRERIAMPHITQVHRAYLAASPGARMT
jgi:hypothetical protein